MGDKIVKTITDKLYGNEKTETAALVDLTCARAGRVLPHRENQPCPHVITSRDGTSYCDLAERPPKPTGWIITHKDGRIIHFSVHDGWTLDIVTTSE